MVFENIALSETFRECCRLLLVFISSFRRFRTELIAKNNCFISVSCPLVILYIANATCKLMNAVVIFRAFVSSNVVANEKI